MLDVRICEKCPLGPEPLTDPVCRRCVADDDAIQMRRALVDEWRSKLTYEGVEYADCMLYDILPNLLPHGDPACG